MLTSCSTKGLTMLGILAAVTFGVAYVLDLVKADPPAALAPPALLLLGLFFLALHLIGVGAGWTVRRP
jgi:hypothetical protein